MVRNVDAADTPVRVPGTLAGTMIELTNVKNHMHPAPKAAIGRDGNMLHQNPHGQASARHPSQSTPHTDVHEPVASPASAVRWTTFGTTAAVAAAVLAGCTYVPGAAGPTSSELVPQATVSPTDAPTPDPFGGVVHPSGEPLTPPQPTEDNRESEMVKLRVGDEDYGELDWQVSCSGITEGSISIIATAKDGEHSFTLVMLGSPDELSSFTFTSGRKGEGLQAKSGLTVTPGTKQGNGSLIVDGGTLKSNGAGVAYGPDIEASNGKTNTTTKYETELYCKLDR